MPGTTLGTGITLGATCSAGSGRGRERGEGVTHACAERRLRCAMHAPPLFAAPPLRARPPHLGGRHDLRLQHGDVLGEEAEGARCGRVGCSRRDQQGQGQAALGPHAFCDDAASGAGGCVESEKLQPARFRLAGLELKLGHSGPAIDGSPARGTRFAGAASRAESQLLPLVLLYTTLHQRHRRRVAQPAAHDGAACHALAPSGPRATSRGYAACIPAAVVISAWRRRRHVRAACSWRRGARRPSGFPFVSSFESDRFTRRYAKAA
jgi:hypothetical protein